MEISLLDQQLKSRVRQNLDVNLLLSCGAPQHSVEGSTHSVLEIKMFKYVPVALAAVLSVSAANAATSIVNLNASNTSPNAGNNSPGYPYNPVTLQLDAGTYSVGVVGISGGGVYDAYAVYAATATNGAYTDGNWSFNANGVVQTQGSVKRFNTAAESLAYYSGLSPLTFTLAATSSVAFFVDDTAMPYFNDNSGGVSLAVRSINGAVPEPASWAMMIVGFGAVGGTLRASRRRALPQIA